MIKLPKWISEFFEQSVCPFKECKKKLEKKGVIAVGVREENDPENKGKVILSFYFEYKCGECGQRSVFTGFPTLMEDFIADIIEISGMEGQMMKGDDFDPEDEGEGEQREKPRSRISDAEFNAARKFIRKCKDGKDFMRFFGINEIEPDEGNEPKNQ